MACLVNQIHSFIFQETTTEDGPSPAQSRVKQTHGLSLFQFQPRHVSFLSLS
jgi:hypothetical protein